MTDKQIKAELDHRATQFIGVVDVWWSVGGFYLSCQNGRFLVYSSPQYINRGEGIALTPNDLLEMLAIMKHWNEVILPRRRNRQE